MTTLDMNNTTDVAIKIDVYTIYLCKSRADLEFELFMSRREHKMIHKHMERGRRQTVVENNLYQTAYDAMNDIDERLGGTGKLGYTKRRERGIRIVRKKNKIG